MTLRVLLFLIIISSLISVLVKFQIIELENKPKNIQFIIYFFFSYIFWISLSYLSIRWHFIKIKKIWIYIFPLALFIITIIGDYIFKFKDVKTSPFILNFALTELWNLPGVLFVGYLTN